MGDGDSEVLTFGAFELDVGEGMLYQDATEVPLPPRALNLLATLLSRPGHLWSKEELLDAVWGDAYVSEGVLKEVVSVLRKALNDDVHNPTYIQTLPRRGYRFVGRLQRVRKRARSTPRSGATAFQTRSWTRPRSMVLALSLLGLLLFLVLAPRRQPAPATRTLAAIEVPYPQQVWPVGLALSRDGRQLAYVGKTDERRLYLRPMDRSEPLEVAGTAGARRPFFAPDGRWMGFFAHGELRIVPTAGGQARSLAKADGAWGATWLDARTIVYATGPTSGLRRIDPVTGDAHVVTLPDAASGEVAHLWPAPLEGRRVLYTGWRTRMEDSRIGVVDLDSLQTQLVVEGGSAPQFLPPGHLLFARPTELLASRFDPHTLALVGQPFSVLEGIDTDSGSGAAEMAISPGGTLVYLKEGLKTGDRSLAWLTADGGRHPTPLPPGRYAHVALAPDDARVALTVVHDGGSDLWTADLRTGDLAPFTFDRKSGYGVWTPDGEHLVYTQHSGREMRILLRRVDAAASAQVLVAQNELCLPLSVTGDKRLVFARHDPRSGVGLWTLSLNEPRRTQRLLPAHRGALRGAALSPQGRWLAYSANDERQSQVFVRAVADGGGPWQVSRAGGTDPQWSADGRRLYFRQSSKLKAVAVARGTVPRFSAPLEEWELGDATVVAPSETGDRLLISLPSPGEPRQQIDLIFGWVPQPVAAAQLR